MNGLLVTLFIIIPIIVGIILVKKYKDYSKPDWDVLGILLIFIFGIVLFVHIIALSLKVYQYELFVDQRNSFEITLNESRKSANELESAAIVKEVAVWNQELSEYKFDNKTFFLDCYIDDRVEDLEFIK